MIYIFIIIYLHGIWFLVRTIAHDIYIHTSVVVASYVYVLYVYIYLQKQPGCKKVRGQSEARL